MFRKYENCVDEKLQLFTFTLAYLIDIIALLLRIESRSVIVGDYRREIKVLNPF